MLDILIPVPAANLQLVPDCIDSIVKCTDYPSRIVVIADGGTRKDLADLESYFSGYSKPWKLLHNPAPVYLNQSIREGLDDCSARIVALVGPQVRLDDSGWFSKVQQIFHRDPTAFVVDTAPNTKSVTLYPMKRAHNHPAGEGCKLAILNSGFAKTRLPYGRVDPVVHWSRAAVASGGSSWTAPGVGYHLVEGAEHELWREPLGSQSRSE